MARHYVVELLGGRTWVFWKEELFLISASEFIIIQSGVLSNLKALLILVTIQIWFALEEIIEKNIGVSKLLISFEE